MRKFFVSAFAVFVCIFIFSCQKNLGDKDKEKEATYEKTAESIARANRPLPSPIPSEKILKTYENVQKFWGDSKRIGIYFDDGSLYKVDAKVEQFGYDPFSRIFYGNEGDHINLFLSDTVGFRLIELEKNGNIMFVSIWDDYLYRYKTDVGIESRKIKAIVLY